MGAGGRPNARPVDMGLPSGTLWSPFNVDARMPGGFADRAESYDASYFSWGNIDPHERTGDSSFAPWSWGNEVDVEPYVSSIGKELDDDIDDAHDAASAICGSQWRIPTEDQFRELLNSCDYINSAGDVITGNRKLTTMGGVVGVRLKSRFNGAVIFLPACGFGTAQDLQGFEARCSYWTRKFSSSAQALCYNVYTTTAGMLQFGRYGGMVIRPVMMP